MQSIWRKSVLLGFILFCAVAQLKADTIAYVVPGGTTANQGFDYPVGMDFVVNSAIWVTSLGVFDSNGDGLLTDAANRPITVSIYQTANDEQPAPAGNPPMITLGLYNPITPTIVAQMDFGANSIGGDGILIGGSRFKDLDSAILLGPGRYTIVEDFGGAEGIGNASGIPKTWTTDDGNGALSFIGMGRYDSSHDIFPTIQNNGVADCFAAGTFAYFVDGEQDFGFFSLAAAEPIPEPTVGMMVIASVIGMVLMGLRRNRIS